MTRLIFTKLEGCLKNFLFGSFCGSYSGFVAKACLFASLGATTIMAASFTALNLVGVIPSQLLGRSYPVTATEIVSTVLLAPLVETFLLIIMLRFVKIFNKNTLETVVVTALLFGVVHGLDGLLRFLPSTWLFFVFGARYLKWRAVSLTKAYFAAFAPHVFNNSLAFGTLMFGD